MEPISNETTMDMVVGNAETCGSVDTDMNTVGARNNLVEGNITAAATADVFMDRGNELRSLRDEILDHVAAVKDAAGIHFKSQQLGEPELNFSERRSIAETLLNRNYNTFLSRFGHHLLDHHLSYFENISSDQSQSDDYEIKYHINRLKKVKRGSRASKVQVRNRRFEAMKRLMSDGEYFSVTEMRKRNPLLFEQLLGGFVQSPSSTSKYDQNDHVVANILLEQIDQDRMAALKETQLQDEIAQAAEQFSSDDEEYAQSLHYCNSDIAVRNSNQISRGNTAELLLWGKSKTMADQVIGEGRWKKEHGTTGSLLSTRENYLTQKEKVLLVNEFTSSMFDSFLQGKDDFDYSAIDENPEYDDVNQCDIDEQDKYFDSECPQEVFVEQEQNMNENNDDKEDELDRFMKDIENQINTENLVHNLKHLKSN